MKKTIFIGKSGCGKTTLIQRIEGLSIAYKKTQMVEHYLNFIDTPGEYLELRSLYRALIVSAADADVIGLVQECGADTTWLPAGMASMFAKPVFGVVSKADLAKSEADVHYATEVLENAGAERVFVVSSTENEGMQPLYDYLQN